LYLSPELLDLKKGEYIDYIDEKKCDVFAFGISMFLGIFFCFPYNTEN